MDQTDHRNDPLPETLYASRSYNGCEVASERIGFFAGGTDEKIRVSIYKKVGEKFITKKVVIEES
jgi:hypothetical protein